MNLIGSIIALIGVVGIIFGLYLLTRRLGKNSSISTEKVWINLGKTLSINIYSTSSPKDKIKGHPGAAGVYKNFDISFFVKFQRINQAFIRVYLPQKTQLELAFCIDENKRGWPPAFGTGVKVKLNDVNFDGIFSLMSKTPGLLPEFFVPELRQQLCVKSKFLSGRNLLIKDSVIESYSPYIEEDPVILKGILDLLIIVALAVVKSGK